MRCLLAIRGATIIKTREDEKRRHKKGGRAEGENTRRYGTYMATLSYVKRICGANKFVRWAMERKDPANKEERTTEKSDGFCSC